MKSLSTQIYPTTINTYFLCPYRLSLFKSVPSEDKFTTDMFKIVTSEASAQTVIKSSIKERGKALTEELYLVLEDVRKIKSKFVIKDKCVLISESFNNSVNSEEIVWSETIPLVYYDGKKEYNYYPLTVYDRALFTAVYTRAAFASNVTKRPSIIAYTYNGKLKKHILTSTSSGLNYILSFVSEYVAKLKMDFILPIPNIEICSFCTAENCSYRIGEN